MKRKIEKDEKKEKRRIFDKNLCYWKNILQKLHLFEKNYKEHKIYSISH
jgi:hypothetical protein